MDFFDLLTSEAMHEIQHCADEAKSKQVKPAIVDTKFQDGNLKKNKPKQSGIIRTNREEDLIRKMEQELFSMEDAPITDDNATKKLSLFEPNHQVKLPTTTRSPTKKRNHQDMIPESGFSQPAKKHKESNSSDIGLNFFDVLTSEAMHEIESNMAAKIPPKRRYDNARPKKSDLIGSVKVKPVQHEKKKATGARIRKSSALLPVAQNGVTNVPAKQAIGAAKNTSVHEKKQTTPEPPRDVTPKIAAKQEPKIAAKQELSEPIVVQQEEKFQDGGIIRTNREEDLIRKMEQELFSMEDAPITDDNATKKLSLSAPNYEIKLPTIVDKEPEQSNSSNIGLNFFDALTFEAMLEIESNMAAKIPPKRRYDDARPKKADLIGSDKVKPNQHENKKATGAQIRGSSAGLPVAQNDVTPKVLAKQEHSEAEVVQQEEKQTIAAWLEKPSAYLPATSNGVSNMRLATTGNDSNMHGTMVQMKRNVTAKLLQPKKVAPVQDEMIREPVPRKLPVSSTIKNNGNAATGVPLHMDEQKNEKSTGKKDIVPKIKVGTEEKKQQPSPVLTDDLRKIYKAEFKATYGPYRYLLGKIQQPANFVLKLGKMLEMKKSAGCDNFMADALKTEIMDVHKHMTTQEFLAEKAEMERLHQRFKTPARLSKHKNVHTDIRPHKCKECGREFREKDTLRVHLRIHTGVMPYECEFCGKRFRFRSILTTHRHQHTGVRPYSCLECNHHFTNWPNYNKHMIRRHGINTSGSTRRPQSKPAPGPVVPIISSGLDSASDLATSTTEIEIFRANENVGGDGNGHGGPSGGSAARRSATFGKR